MASRGQRARASAGWRGRGRGSSGRHFTSRTDDNPVSETPAVAANKSNPSSKPRLTHFLALPLGHHDALRHRLSAFTNTLLEADPPISGLDESIIIAPRRLHLTLGVMSLDSTPPTETLSAAISLLQSLKPRVTEILGKKKLRVALNRMDIMKPSRGDLEQAQVLWVGPLLEDEDARRLHELAEMIRKAFLDANLMIDEKRPLKLHCTVMNTVHRKPRSKGSRQPFSYPSILASRAFQSIGGVSTSQKGPKTIDLGVWDVDEVQICEMGSHGSQGEYVSCGGCSLS